MPAATLQVSLSAISAPGMRAGSAAVPRPAVSLSLRPAAPRTASAATAGAGSLCPAPRTASAGAGGHWRVQANPLGMLERLVKPGQAEKEEDPAPAPTPAPSPAAAAPAASAAASDADDDEVALVRPVLVGTVLETAPLRLAFDAQRDGWSADEFHSRIDGQGPALVVALTTSGTLMGGYNPKGWEGQGGDIGAADAFLFVSEDGEDAVTLPKVGGASEAICRDAPGEGIHFGRDGLIAPLAPGKERFVKSKLGAYYQRKPNGARHLMMEGSPVKGGSRGTELASLHVWVAA